MPFPNPERIVQGAVGKAMVLAFLERPAAFQGRAACLEAADYLAVAEVPDEEFVAELL